MRIRHGIAQHVMKSRVRAYKNRAKGSGWQANWREHFYHSLTLKTSFFPLSIRLLFGPITIPQFKNQRLYLTLTPTRKWVVAQKPPDAASSNGEAQERRLSYPAHRFIALWKHIRCSLRTLSFYLIRHKNDYIVRFRCKYSFFLFFTTCDISLFQVDLASH